MMELSKRISLPSSPYSSSKPSEEATAWLSPAALVRKLDAEALPQGCYGRQMHFWFKPFCFLFLVTDVHGWMYRSKPVEGTSVQRVTLQSQMQSCCGLTLATGSCHLKY